MKIRRTCQEVTRLVLQSQDRPLRPLEKASLNCTGWPANAAVTSACNKS